MREGRARAEEVRRGSGAHAVEELQVPTELPGDESLAVVRQPVDADHVALAKDTKVLLLRRRDGGRLRVRRHSGAARDGLDLWHKLVHLIRVHPWNADGFGVFRFLWRTRGRIGDRVRGVRGIGGREGQRGRS
eukprot:2383292-Prymnesium_polylepis.2